MKKKSILLVDDDENLLHSISRDLTLANYEVAITSNGQDAIQLLANHHFNLVVTDMKMPEIGGLKVLQEAKKINPEVCVFLLTGYGDMTSAIEALRLGADDYLLKPCDMREFLLRISRHLEKQEAFQKLKMYEKIMPVCSYCKKIRDDTGTMRGKGAWMSMEQYFRIRQGVLTSHGCCPDCIDKIEND